VSLVMIEVVKAIAAEKLPKGYGYGLGWFLRAG
jgi:hypothetical protein